MFLFKCSTPVQLFKCLKVQWDFFFSVWVLRYNLRLLVRNFIKFKLKYYFLVDIYFRFYEICNLMLIECLSLDIHKQVIFHLYSTSVDRNLDRYFVILWYNFSS